MLRAVPRPPAVLPVVVVAEPNQRHGYVPAQVRLGTIQLSEAPELEPLAVGVEPAAPHLAEAHLEQPRRVRLHRRGRRLAVGAATVAVANPPRSGFDPPPVSLAALLAVHTAEAACSFPVGLLV